VTSESVESITAYWFVASHRAWTDPDRVPRVHTGADTRRQSTTFGAAVQRLGKNLKRLRAIRGMTQEGLAEAAGCTPRYIQRLEGGDAVNATMRMLAGLAAALDADIGELLRKPGAARGVPRRTPQTVPRTRRPAASGR